MSQWEYAVKLMRKKGLELDGAPSHRARAYPSSGALLMMGPPCVSQRYTGLYLRRRPSRTNRRHDRAPRGCDWRERTSVTLLEIVYK